MTKKELIKALSCIGDDTVIVCEGQDGGWDNIESLETRGSTCAIIFGGGSPFSSDKEYPVKKQQEDETRYDLCDHGVKIGYPCQGCSKWVKGKIREKF